MVEAVTNLCILVNTIIIDDDEDYDDDGSGSEEYSTTRPKREMTEGYKVIETIETTTGTFSAASTYLI